MNYRLELSMAIAFFFLLGSTAAAQNIISVKAGVISNIDGIAYLDDQLLQPTKDSLFQMENGQRLKTLRGFAEVVLTPETYLRLGEGSCVRMEQNKISDIRSSVESGSVLIEVIENIRTDPIRVHFQTASVEIRHGGLYRINTPPGEVYVYGGEAVVTDRGKDTIIKSGKKYRLNIDLQPVKFSRKDQDELHQWAARRSFELFIASSDTGRQFHWVSTALGWLINSNYRMRFQSLKFLAEYIQKKMYRQMPPILPSPSESHGE
jgi:hypothetical protein